MSTLCGMCSRAPVKSIDGIGTQEARLNAAIERSNIDDFCGFPDSQTKGVHRRTIPLSRAYGHDRRKLLTIIRAALTALAPTSATKSRRDGATSIRASFPAIAAPSKTTSGPPTRLPKGA